MKAIQVREPGGPEQLQLVDVPVPVPGPGQALVRIAASGVNFIDIYFRTGLYKADSAGHARQRSRGHRRSGRRGRHRVAPGDRVAYAMVRGSYAEYAVVPAAQLVKVPDAIDFDAAAAAMLQGMTAHYLTHSTFPLSGGQTCLVHAAAGGAGRLIAQMAKRAARGCIGTVSTEEKAAVAAEAGVDHPIIYTASDFESRGEAHHRRRRRRRGLRLGRQDDVREEPGLPASARHDGAVRAVERAGAATRTADPEHARVAVPDPAEPRALSAVARGTAVARRRRASPPWSAGQLRAPDRSRVPARARPPRPIARWSREPRPASCS